MPREERSYTPADRTRALDAYVKLGSYAAAAQQTDIPEKTVENWAKHPESAGELAEIGAEHARAERAFRASLADKAWHAAEKGVAVLLLIAEHGTEERDRVSAARGLADVAAKLDGARRLDANMPTAIVEQRGEKSGAEVIAEVERLLNVPELRDLFARQR